MNVLLCLIFAAAAVVLASRPLGGMAIRSAQFIDPRGQISKANVTHAWWGGQNLQYDPSYATRIARVPTERDSIPVVLVTSTLYIRQGYFELRLAMLHSTKGELVWISSVIDRYSRRRSAQWIRGPTYEASTATGLPCFARIVSAGAVAVHVFIVNVCKAIEQSQDGYPPHAREGRPASVVYLSYVMSDWTDRQTMPSAPAFLNDGRNVAPDDPHYVLIAAHGIIWDHSYPVKSYAPALLSINMRDARLHYVQPLNQDPNALIEGALARSSTDPFWASLPLLVKVSDFRLVRVFAEGGKQQAASVLLVSLSLVASPLSNAHIIPRSTPLVAVLAMYGSTGRMLGSWVMSCEDPGLPCNRTWLGVNTPTQDMPELQFEHLGGDSGIESTMEVVPVVEDGTEGRGQCSASGSVVVPATYSHITVAAERKTGAIAMQGRILPGDGLLTGPTGGRAEALKGQSKAVGGAFDADSPSTPAIDLPDRAASGAGSVNGIARQDRYISLAGVVGMRLQVSMDGCSDDRNHAVSSSMSAAVGPVWGTGLPSTRLLLQTVQGDLVPGGAVLVQAKAPTADLSILKYDMSWEAEGQYGCLMQLMELETGRVLWEDAAACLLPVNYKASWMRTRNHQVGEVALLKYPTGSSSSSIISSGVKAGAMAAPGSLRMDYRWCIASMHYSSIPGRDIMDTNFTAHLLLRDLLTGRVLRNQLVASVAGMHLSPGASFPSLFVGPGVSNASVHGVVAETVNCTCLTYVCSAIRHDSGMLATIRACVSSRVHDGSSQGAADDRGNIPWFDLERSYPALAAYPSPGFLPRPTASPGSIPAASASPSPGGAGPGHSGTGSGGSGGVPHQGMYGGMAFLGCACAVGLAVVLARWRGAWGGGESAGGYRRVEEDEDGSNEGVLGGRRERGEAVLEKIADPESQFESIEMSDAVANTGRKGSAGASGWGTSSSGGSGGVPGSSQPMLLVAEDGSPRVRRRSSGEPDDEYEHAEHGSASGGIIMGGMLGAAEVCHTAVEPIEDTAEQGGRGAMVPHARVGAEV